jgi:xylulokinase
MLLLGIDVGTQSLKAVAVDAASFEVRGRGSRPLAVRHPFPGAAEQSPLDWLRALSPAIGEALRAAVAGPADVAAVGVTGQLDGCVAVDREGRPLGEALIWMDRRATAALAGIDPGLVRARAGLVADASHQAAKIRWLLDRGGLPAGVRFHQPVSFLVEQLTAAFVQDRALASTSMLFGLAAQDWDDELCRVFAIDPRLLPELADASDPAGEVTTAGAELSGLRPGTPVAVGTGDDFANAIGAGVTRPGTVLCCVGTAEVVGAVHDQTVVDEDSLVETHAFPGGRYFVENPGWLSGGAMRWVRDLLGVGDWSALDALAERVPVGSDGVTALPTLTGALAPEWLAHARGAVYGLTPGHGPGHLVRAVQEGAAFAMADVVDRLSDLGVATDRIRLAGGGARSALWARMRAAVAERPVELVDVEDVAAQGAVACAAVAGRTAASLAEAADRLARVRGTVMPDPADVAAYRPARERARALFAALRPIMVEPWAAA